MIAEGLLESVNTRDIARLRSLLAPDVVYWNNVDQCELDLDGLVSHLEQDFAFFKEFRYVDAACHAFDDGFVLRMRGNARTLTGAALDFPICIVGLVRERAIVRLEDWVNPQHLTPGFGGAK